MEKKNGILPVSLVTADEMRAYDTYTIQNIGIHTEVLMERAALALADECMLLLKDAHKKPREAKALCVCGTGNNGGDGLACARLLADRGVEAKVLLVGNKEKLSEAAATGLRCPGGKLWRGWFSGGGVFRYRGCPVWHRTFPKDNRGL